LSDIVSDSAEKLLKLGFAELDFFASLIASVTKLGLAQAFLIDVSTLENVVTVNGFLA
jgi:hypothetical protein